MAKVTFLGAAQEVTGSCHLLESEATGRVILDCGMHQGGDAIKRIQKDNFDFDIQNLDAVILSHAHLDHSGLLPKLVSKGFSGPIFCTSATADLLRIMLKDAAGIYERDLARENLRAERKGRKRRLQREYTQGDVDRVLALCQKIPYRKQVQFGEGASLTFHDAGHILGSAITEIKFQEAGEDKCLVYSGDLGNKDSILMNDPAQLDQASLVLMETTYGNRNHRNMDATLNELKDILSRTWERGGNVLIPSFAVGRTQEMLFYLGHLYYEGHLDQWQVFLDSPMALQVTKLYEKWLHLLDADDVKELTDVQKLSLEEFLPSLQISETPQDSMAINEFSKGVIVIAGSGMCTGGRIRHHLKHRVWRAENTLLFVGFQAAGTLGRKLVDGASSIRMFNEEFAVKAAIETLGGFSAHAGQNELLDWITGFSNKPKVALVHGETQSMQALATRLEREHDIACEIPARNEEISF